MDDFVIVVALAVAMLLLVAVVLGVGRSETDRASVTVLDPGDGPRVTIDVHVAASATERYRGLAAVDELDSDEGMLFVFNRPANRSFVMRGVDYPIDVVFINESARVTAIHTAEPESRPFTRYSGYGKWVLEVPAGTANRTGMRIGDRVLIDTSGE